MNYEQYEPLQKALIGYYESGKSGKIEDHLPAGAEMVDSRYIVYEGRRERLDQWCRMLDVYNAPDSYNVKGNYQSRVRNPKPTSTSEPTRSRRPLSSLSDEELVTLAQKTAERFNKAVEEARKIGQEYGVEVQVSDTNILNIIYAKLKEKRDTVTKESVEKDLQKAISRLSFRGDFALISRLTTLFGEGKFKEVRDLLQTN